MAIEFKRNKETGEVEAYEDGKLVGKVESMGDNLADKSKDEQEEKKTSK